MSTTKIQWTDRTWNPVRGCTRVSEGCRNCYAERFAARNLPGLRSPTTGESFARMTEGGPRWTGAVEFLPHKLAEPLGWKKPQRVFVNSMSDLFHEDVADDQIAAIFGVMLACPHLDFQVLTKRPERMRRWFGRIGMLRRVRLTEAILAAEETVPIPEEWVWPGRNIWLGVSVEDQATADERVPILLETPAAVRFVSYEPALGPVDFTRVRTPSGVTWDTLADHADREGPALDWIIAGGESGPGARPPHPEWFTSVRDQCASNGVPFFFKQWGDWHPLGNGAREKSIIKLRDGRQGHAYAEIAGFPFFPDQWNDQDPTLMHRRGSAPNDLLDGDTHHNFPEVSK